MKQDNFEHIINRKLDQAGKKPEAWNTPPASIFDGAMEEVNQPKKQKRRAFILPLMALLLISSAAAFYVLNSGTAEQRKTTELIEKTDLNQNLSKVTPKITTPLNTETNTNTATTKVEPIKIESASTPANKRNQAAVKQAPIKKTEIKTVTNQASNKQNPSNTGATLPPANRINKTTIALANEASQKVIPAISAEQIARNTTSATTARKDRVNSSTSEPTVKNMPAFSIGGLALKAFDQEETTPPALAFTSSSHDKESVDYVRRTLGLSTQLLNSKNICEGTSTEMETAVGYQSSFGLSLNYEQSINEHWSWGSMLSWSSLRSSALSKSETEYNATNESIENGVDYYNTPMDVETPFGLFSSLAAFPVDLSINHDDDVINFESNIEQRLQLATIHFMTKRYFGNHSKTRFFVGPNIGYNHILNLKSDMDMKIEMNDQVMMEKKEIHKNKFDLKQGFLSVGLQVGLEQRISENSFLTLGLGGSQSLTSLRKSQVASLKVNQFNVSLGIVRSLGHK